jgi:hypothetical protein
LYDDSEAGPHGAAGVHVGSPALPVSSLFKVDKVLFWSMENLMWKLHTAHVLKGMLIFLD